MEKLEASDRGPAIPEMDPQRKPPVPIPPSPESQQVNSSRAVSNYANFCRLSANPEELVVDFGIHFEAIRDSSSPVAVSSRVVTSWYTARRLLQVLHLCVERHESAFGRVETNVEKRAQPSTYQR